MADVIFVTPNSEGTILDESIGTLLLATILRKEGMSAEIVQFFQFGDVNNFPVFLQAAAEMILQKNPKIVSFYTRCDNYHIMLSIAEEIKKRKEIYIVFAGPQADITSEETIRAMPYVDFVCCGEGENTVYPFFESLLEDSPNLRIPGLVYRKDKDVVKNQRPALVENLDQIPEPDYSLLPYEISSKDELEIDVGRGCPFNCTFCSTKTFWGRKYRLKSPKRIVEEIKNLHEAYGITKFAFSHDMFTMSRKQVLETCSLIQKLDFSIQWRCSARIDCIDTDLVDVMTEAGLRRIYFGIETGSDRMQRLTNKNLPLDQIIKKLTYLKSKGITYTVSFIYGFPEETEEDVSQTIALICEIAKLKPYAIQTHLCTFLPGTELTDRYKSQLMYTDHFSDITGSSAISECKELILNNPKIFFHFQEYHTELRDRLKFLPQFIKMWQIVSQVYEYISESYDRSRLVDMYFDFVEANCENLCHGENQSKAEQIGKILENDGLIKKLRDNQYYDIILDIYRIARINRSEKLDASGYIITEVFSISPAEIKSGIRLQDIKQKITFVTFEKKNGKIDMIIKCL